MPFIASSILLANASGSYIDSYAFSKGFPNAVPILPPSICKCAECSIALSSSINCPAAVSTDFILSPNFSAIAAILVMPSIPFLKFRRLAIDKLSATVLLNFWAFKPCFIAVAYAFDIAPCTA